MLNKKEFFETVVETINEMIPEESKSEIEVTVREVVKNNDEKLHGVTLLTSENGCMPTIYLEDCYEEYLKGASVEEIAEDIIRGSAKWYFQAEQLIKFSFDYENIRDKLVVQLLDSEKNKERLKGLVYEPVGNGFVMISYIVMHSDTGGRLRTAVTKGMAEEFGYDVIEVMRQAFANTVEQYEPVFIRMEEMYSMQNLLEEDDFIRKGDRITNHSRMYVLSNKVQMDGAVTLFYPGMMKHISELLSDSYYVLPSSVHETIIVPESTDMSLRMLQMMVKDVNKTAVESKDLLSDKVLFYDRKKEKLIIPKVK